MVPKKSDSNPSLFLHRPHRLVYSKKIESNNNNNTNNDDNFIKPTNFENETKCLNTLQKSIDKNIEKQRTILDALSHEFENVMIV